MRRSMACAYSCMLLAILPAFGCSSDQSNTRGGALLGGLFGAGAGALIAGPHNAGTGALVGAGVGAATGAAIGSSADEEERDRNRSVATAVTASDVVAMSKANVPEKRILETIRIQGVAAKPDASAIVYMTQNNVSSKVIDAMQAAKVVKPRVVAYEYIEPAPVVVVGTAPPPHYHHHPPPW